MTHPGDSIETINTAIEYALSSHVRGGGFILVASGKQQIYGAAVCVKTNTENFLPVYILSYLCTNSGNVNSDLIKKLIRETRKLGSTLSDPFMQISFIALPVIPKLKLTDKGLMDVEKFEFIDLFVR